MWPHNNSCSSSNMETLCGGKEHRDFMVITPTLWQCLEFPLLSCTRDVVSSTYRQTHTHGCEVRLGPVIVRLSG